MRRTLLSPTDVSAVIVTKGDVDLAPVLESLIFDDVVVWDNSVEQDMKTYGRVLGAMRARNPVVYSQDDDIVHSRDNQEAILAAYEPGVLTGCMWREWSDGARGQGIENGYDDLVFPGSGSVCDRTVWADAINAYLDHWPFDDFMRLWSDTIIGIIAPTKQLDIRFDPLPCADAANRMAKLPNAVALKTEAIRRARAAAGKPSEHDLYLAGFGTRRRENRPLEGINL